ncbi:MAG: hypothetical protein ACREQY_06630 [Candidatus Binatia bacterium]
MSREECVLCRVARGELRARVVVATRRVFGVINDTEPQSRGHIVFFPRRSGIEILDPPAEYPQYAPAGYYAVFFADPDRVKLEYVYTPEWPV